MNTSRLFTTYFVFGLIAVFTLSVIYFAYAHPDTDTDSASDSAKNASCSATAKHYHYGPVYGYYDNFQWAGFSASISAKGNDIGDKVDGKYSITAYVSGQTGSGSESKPFTLKVKGIKIFGKTIAKWGQTRMANKSDWDSSYVPATSGYATAEAEVGTAKTKKCKT